MPFRVSGKNIDIGEALRDRVNGRIAEALEKYFDGGGYSGHVTIDKEAFGFRTECVVHLDSGISLHANAVAEIMGSFPVLVPPAPGLLCATGDLVADFRGEFARTFIRTVDRVSGDDVRGILEELGSEARAWLEREGIPSGSQREIGRAHV